MFLLIYLCIFFRQMHDNEGHRGQLPRVQQPRWHKGAQNGVNKKICEIFCETRAVFAKCIMTKIVSWLLNRLGLSENFLWGAYQNICPQAPSSHVMPLSADE